MNYLKTIVEAIQEKQGRNVSVLDIKQISTLSDYFVITDADNERQAEAIAYFVESEMEKNGVECRQKEGYGTSRWIILDYGEVMVHIFHSEEREFYNLERLWKDAPYVDLDVICSQA